MSEDGGERKRRLKALKEKAAKSVNFRNYRPQDAAIRQQARDNEDKGKDKGSSSSNNNRSGRGITEGKEAGRAREAEEMGGEEGVGGKRQAPTPSLIQQELKKQKEAQDEEELNIAPKKANWDLKRDVEKKLEKLDRRTQRAIVEIIRERLAEEAANASSSSGSGEDAEEDSGSSSSGEEDSGGSSSEDEE